MFKRYWKFIIAGVLVLTMAVACTVSNNYMNKTIDETYANNDDSDDESTDESSDDEEESDESEEEEEAGDEYFKHLEFIASDEDDNVDFEFSQ